MVALLTAGVIIYPALGRAQRFEHGGQQQRPAAQPQARPSMPVNNRPAQQPAATQPVTPRPSTGGNAGNGGNTSINGGSRNYGNHDLGRNVNTPSQNSGNRQGFNNNQGNAGQGNYRSVTVDRGGGRQSQVTIRSNVNVYHTGGYRGNHAYSYHPYKPYYWGQHWHPVGYILAALASDAIRISLNSRFYYYDDGCFYEPSGNGGYAVVDAPQNAIVSALPDGYETATVDDVDYYYFGGVFYVAVDQGFQVVAAPPGAVIYQLPTGAIETQINGQTLLAYNNAYYLPISENGDDAYEVVTP